MYEIQYFGKTLQEQNVYTYKNPDGFYLLNHDSDTKPTKNLWKVTDRKLQSLGLLLKV